MTIDEIKDIAVSDPVFTEEFEDAIIGLDSNERVIFDFELMAECLMAQNDWDYTEAIDWLDYNTMRTLPYIPEETRPIILEAKLEK